MPEVYAAHPEYAFPRNFKGYGENGLEGLKWPNNAKIAVSFVINYEEVRWWYSNRSDSFSSCPLIMHRVANAQS
jgi:hypothetical protein